MVGAITLKKQILPVSLEIGRRSLSCDIVPADDHPNDPEWFVFMKVMLTLRLGTRQIVT
jgi:hypothetical protein